jgi:hypothetical protein
MKRLKNISPSRTKSKTTSSNIGSFFVSGEDHFEYTPVKSKSFNSVNTTYSSFKTVSPNLGSFFVSDEDYFEYTPVKSKSFNSVNATYSPSRTRIKSKTVSPNLRFLYGEDDSF